MIYSTEDVFSKVPRGHELYLAFASRIHQMFQEVKVKVSKTQVSFSNRYVFAIASVPLRRKKEWPKECILITFGLPFQLEDPRIVEAVEAYPRRWTHHVLIQREDEIDEELMEWIGASYQFSLEK